MLCTNPVNMPDPICIWSDQLCNTGQKQARWFLQTSLLLDQICLAKTWYSQSEPNQIQAGFAQYHLGNLWKNATESERGKLVAGQLFCQIWAWWFLYIGLLPDQIHLAKTWQAIQIRSGLVLNDMIQAFFGKKEKTKSDVGSQIHLKSGCTLAEMATIKCKQNASESDPACLLGTTSLTSQNFSFLRLNFKIKRCFIQLERTWSTIIILCLKVHWLNTDFINCHHYSCFFQVLFPVLCTLSHV